MKRYFLLIASLVFSSAQASDLTNKTFVNVQAHKTVKNGTTYNFMSIGYYRFTSNSRLTYDYFAFQPHQNHNNTLTNYVHPNITAGRDGSTSLSGACTNSQDIRGKLHFPTHHDHRVFTNKPYTFDGNKLIVEMGDVVHEWHLVNATKGRWSIPGTYYRKSNGSHVIDTYTYLETIAYGYFSDDWSNSIELMNGGLNFETNLYHPWGYGKSSGNGVSNKSGDSAGDFIYKNDDARFVTQDFDNSPISSYQHLKVFGKIWDKPGGNYIQDSYVINHNPNYPTMIFQNQGNVFYNEMINIYPNTLEDCWDIYDTQRTQGHTKVLLGAWDEDARKISSFVRIEVSKNGNYPYIGVAYQERN